MVPSCSRVTCRTDEEWFPLALYAAEKVDDQLGSRERSKKSMGRRVSGARRDGEQESRSRATHKNFLSLGRLISTTRQKHGETRGLFKTRPGIHSRQNKHSVRTHGSTVYHTVQTSTTHRASRSQSYCWNTVAGSRLQATFFAFEVKT